MATRKNIRILLDDGNQIERGTGIGRYSQYVFDFLQRSGFQIELTDRRFAGGDRTRKRLEYLWHINSRTYQRELEARYDLVFYTNYTVPFVKNGHTKYIATIHDMVSYLYPETLPAAYRVYNRETIRNTVHRAELIFTDSESVKREITSVFPGAENKIKSTWVGTYESIRPMETYRDYDNPPLHGIDNSPFFLFVSTVEKRKNVKLVIEAFDCLKRIALSAAGWKLVIVGRPGYGYEEIFKAAKESSSSQDILFAGFTSDEDCNRLYNHAKAFVFPTTYEGFGSAQTECMRCHLPLICSDIKTNREISREYGLYFHLDDPSSLVDQMRNITDGKYDYARYNRLADQYLTDFSWEKVGGRMIEGIESIC